MSSHHSTSDTASHGSVASYALGFLLSLVLTAWSFGAVMSGAVPHDLRLPAIVAFAVIQLVAQLIFFLHLGLAREQRSDLAALAFTGLILATIVSGSLWVMHNANVNMMPTGMSADMAKVKD